MERFARGFVIGVAISGTTLVMFKVNHMVLTTLSAVNETIATALLRLVLAPPLELRTATIRNTKNND